MTGRDRDRDRIRGWDVNRQEESEKETKLEDGTEIDRKRPKNIQHSGMGQRNRRKDTQRKKDNFGTGRGKTARDRDRKRKRIAVKRGGRRIQRQRDKVTWREWRR